jgi:mannosyltransferase OCH1-like enzyme
VWITKEGKARNPFNNSEEKEMVEQTLKTLNGTQKISLWTNEIKRIPEAWDWAKAHGIKVHELRELEIFKEYE